MNYKAAQGMTTNPGNDKDEIILSVCVWVWVSVGVWVYVGVCFKFPFLEVEALMMSYGATVSGLDLLSSCHTSPLPTILRPKEFSRRTLVMFIVHTCPKWFIVL